MGEDRARRGWVEGGGWGNKGRFLIYKTNASFFLLSLSLRPPPLPQVPPHPTKVTFGPIRSSLELSSPVSHVPVPSPQLDHGERDEAHPSGEDRGVAGLLQVGGVGGALGDAAGVVDGAGGIDLGGGRRGVRVKGGCLRGEWVGEGRVGEVRMRGLATYGEEKRGARESSQRRRSF